MPRSTITSKGQVTLPKEVREHLHVATGDGIDFVVAENGTVFVQPIRSRIDDLRGMLHRKRRRAVSVDEMHAAIARVHGGR